MLRYFTSESGICYKARTRGRKRAHICLQTALAHFSKGVKLSIRGTWK